MQVFLPYPDVQKSVESLDYKRLGKQRLECSQLMKAVHDPKGGWHNHPAAVMFRGHTGLLAMYHDAAIKEWVRRGYQNTMSTYDVVGSVKYPWWWGSAHFHLSHQDNLIRKDEEHYRPLFGPPWTRLGHYYWPREEQNKFLIGTTNLIAEVPYSRYHPNVSSRSPV